MATAITEENVQKTVYEALPQFGVDESQIARDATFEDLDVDSLDLAELSQIIEDEYGVALKGDDVGKIKTVGDSWATGATSTAKTSSTLSCSSPPATRSFAVTCTTSL
jgi:acyl carrier protein